MTFLNPVVQWIEDGLETETGKIAGGHAGVVYSAFSKAATAATI